MFREIYDLKKKILVIFGSPLIYAYVGCITISNQLNAWSWII